MNDLLYLESRMKKLARNRTPMQFFANKAVQIHKRYCGHRLAPPEGAGKVWVLSLCLHRCYARLKNLDKKNSINFGGKTRKFELRPLVHQTETENLSWSQLAWEHVQLVLHYRGTLWFHQQIYKNKWREIDCYP